MTHLSKILFVCCLLSQIMACTDNIDGNTPMDKSATEPTTTSTTTISGIVYDLQSGKDGYTATISTADTTIYYAVVSIPNVGGLENYTKLELGSAVTLSGELLKNGSENNFIVRTIDNQQPTELCWLATKTTNLYSAPNADSKNYGKFFQGETLTVLADPIQNNNQNWTKVYFRNTVKAGYENQFADGRPMHEGIERMVGWISSTEEQIISCK